MAYEIPGRKLTLLAGADLSAKQYYAVKVNSSGAAVLSGAGEQAIGLLQGAPTSGQAAEITTEGVSKGILGGSVTAGQNLMADASGKLVTQTGTNASIGIALVSGSSGDLCSVYVTAGSGSGIASSYSVMSIPVQLSQLANGDIVTEYTPGFAGSIVKASFAVTVPATTAAKAATLNLEIGTTNLTGGVIALTSANCTPLGKVNDGTAITAGNTFTSTDAISVEAASVTAFVEGAGVLLLVLKSA